MSEMSERMHELKTWPGPFQAVIDGRKRFEVRRDDRGYAVGDSLLLREWEPSNCVGFRYTGRDVTVQVTYLMEGERWGIMSRFVVMGIRVLEVGDDGGDDG